MLALTMTMEALGQQPYVANSDARVKSLPRKATTTVHEYANIKDFIQAVNSKEITNKDNVKLKLNNAKVLASGKYNIFVRDETNTAACLRFSSLSNQEDYNGKYANSIVSGEISGILDYYTSALFLCIYPKSQSDVSNLTFTENTEEAQPVEIEPSEMDAHKYDLVKLSGLVVTTTDGSSSSADVSKIKLGGQIKFSKDFVTNGSLVSSAPLLNKAVVDVVGIVTSMTDISIRTFDDITYVIGENRTNTLNKSVMSNKNIRLERTLSNAYWNSFCVPMILSKSVVEKVFGANTKIAEYEGNDGTVMQFKSVSSITAGKPCLIKPEYTVVNPVFKSATVSTTITNTPSSSAAYQLVGVYNPTVLKTDQTDLFITTKGEISYPTEGHNTIKGLRAYIHSNTSSSKDITLSLDGIETDIHTIDACDISTSRNKIYNMNGQYVGDDVDNLPKGLYVINRQKVYIK